MEAGGALRLSFAAGCQAASGGKRPIAPGNDSCPAPPWDTAFPGAFFFNGPVSELRQYPFARLTVAATEGSHAVELEETRAMNTGRSARWDQDPCLTN